jgi:hypothetical protein
VLKFVKGLGELDVLVLLRLEEQLVATVPMSEETVFSSEST